jgi:long-chain fatty acid transport protein
MREKRLTVLLAASLRGILSASSIALLCPFSVADGSGFAIPESSAAGLGTANAIVANPDERGAFAYNAAAMGFHEESSVAAGGTFYAPDLSVDTLSGSHHSDGADLLFTPNLQAALRLSDRWRLGLGLNVPFGLETKWQLGTFPMLSAPIPTPIPGLVIPAGLDHPTQTKLEVFAIVPTTTYKISDDISVAVGVDYYRAREAVLDTYVTQLSGDGDGWGWNLSSLYSSGPWSLGVSFHSAPTIEIDGNATSSFPVSASVGTELSLSLPWRLQVGVRYSANDVLALEFDWSRTGWSEFERLDIKSRSTGEILSSERTDWKDASAYRLGATWDVAPDTRLRLGYAFDETGEPNANFTPRIPDSDRQLFSIGVGRKLSKTWELDAAYTYVYFKDRNFDGDKPYQPTQRINGTNAVNGDYRLSAHVFAIELSTAF